ncbi:MAG: type I restriction enzyme M protein [Yoonia sp.]|jgi:type I restriction enzyme M protein
MPANTKNTFLGMLFLKRASDLFDQRQEELKSELKSKGMSDGDIAVELDDPDNYSGKYFFVPHGPVGARVGMKR